MSETDITFEYSITESEYEKIFNFLSKYADQIAYDVNERLAQECYKKALKISKDAIAAFYSAYSPNLYERTGSLYDVFDIQVLGDDFIFAIDDDLMGWHRSNEAVMELDVMQGYHGGKKWRTPPHVINGGMMVKTEGNIMQFATHSWQYWHYKPAVQTYPPFLSISIKWSSFLKGEYQILKKKIINEVASKYASYM